MCRGVPVPGGVPVAVGVPCIIIFDFGLFLEDKIASALLC
jgi:hypothetical protein